MSSPNDSLVISVISDKVIEKSLPQNILEKTSESKVMRIKKREYDWYFLTFAIFLLSQS